MNIYHLQVLTGVKYLYSVDFTNWKILTLLLLSQLLPVRPHSPAPWWKVKPPKLSTLFGDPQWWSHGRGIHIPLNSLGTKTVFVHLINMGVYIYIYIYVHVPRVCWCFFSVEQIFHIAMWTRVFGNGNVLITIIAPLTLDTAEWSCTVPCALTNRITLLRP